MRHLALAFLVLAVGCGDEGTGMDMSMDMPAPDLNMQDMTIPPDFAGVGCGMMTCDTTTQECCATLNGTMLSASCVAKGQCNGDAGAVIQCDGPEDCSGLPASANAGCCVALSGSMGDPDAGMSASGSGSSSCVNNCIGLATFDGQNLSVNTKLCHTTADCTGYMGTLSIFGAPQQEAFTACCHSSQTGSYSFCFNAGTASMTGGAVSCN